MIGDVVEDADKVVRWFGLDGRYWFIGFYQIGYKLLIRYSFKGKLVFLLYDIISLGRKPAIETSPCN